MNKLMKQWSMSTEGGTRVEPMMVEQEGKCLEPNDRSVKNRATCAVPVYAQRAAQVLLVLMLLVAVQQQSHAGFVYSFNTSGTNQDFLVGAGAIVNVPVYLVQTDGEDRLSTIGLFSAGASVAYSYGSGAPLSATVNSATLAAHWNDTPSNLVDFQPSRVVLEGMIEDPLFPVYATSNSVLLGTVQFQAGEFGNVTNLELSLNGVTATWNNLSTELDSEVTPIIFRTGTITAVPEPTSLCLVAVAAAVGMLRRNRRLYQCESKFGQRVKG